MLLYHDASLGRRMRRRLAHSTGTGLRAHPVLTLALLAMVAALAVTAAAVLFVLLIVAAVALAAGALCYVAGRALLRSHLRVRTAQARRPEIALRPGVERYLGSVDEFARLLQTASELGTSVRPGDRRLRRALRDGEKLQGSLRELARYWRGPSTIGSGVYELEDAAIALGLYLKQLTRDEGARPPASVLRAQSEALNRRLDAIALRLRRTDYRTVLDAVRT